MTPPRRRRPRLQHERRILALGLVGGLPGLAVALALLWTGDFGGKLQWTLSILIVLTWWGAGFALRERVTRPLQTLSNMLAALREGDFSIRARGAGTADALALAFLEANELEQTLREQRLGALEATTLLRKVIGEIDVAVFAFDDQQRLRLVNRAGARLLASTPERLLRCRAREVGLDACLRGTAPRTMNHTFPGGGGRWEVRRSRFRQGGRPHTLLVIADLRRALREEELKAWQRLVRVLSHEINNSLAPIKSIAGSLSGALAREPRSDDWEQDLRRGLSIIAGRSEALGRFMAAYARLARLPRPQRRGLEVAAWVRRVAELEHRLPVRVRPGSDLTIQGDGDQLDQLLINLIRNGVDAALDTGGTVQVGWRQDNGMLDVWVEDEGPGLAETANLFVPFYTTKPHGSGIGLVLCRQIAEGHGGSVTLENRDDGSGCRARLTLPLQPA